MADRVCDTEQTVTKERAAVSGKTKYFDVIDSKGEFISRMVRVQAHLQGRSAWEWCAKI